MNHNGPAFNDNKVSFLHYINRLGNFLENYFCTLPPQTPHPCTKVIGYHFCTWISYVTHGYIWSCGRSARPPSLSEPQSWAQKYSLNLLTLKLYKINNNNLAEN